MKPIAVLSLVAVTGLLSSAGRLSADEWESSPYYEEDGLLDITEWLDGNNYNPTDEAWWRWDDEKYEAADDTSRDVDNDWWYGYYGPRGADDWFFDYYDPHWHYHTARPGFYDYGWRYYDYDGDGSYDASVWWSDRDNDGLYDQYAYYTYSDVGNQQQQQQRARSEAPTSSREQSVTGAIEKIKDVQTRDATHKVVSIKAGDKTVIADLGKTSDISSLNLKSGAQITVKGPMSKVADQSVVLARSFDYEGRNQVIERKPREITGIVQDTHRTKVRGREKLIALVQVTDKDQKMAVDLGPADKLGTDIRKGAKLTFSGVPVKVKDQRLVMAHSITRDGKIISIDRRRNEATESRKQSE